jgi:hypothetical protein
MELLIVSGIIVITFLCTAFLSGVTGIADRLVILIGAIMVILYVYKALKILLEKSNSSKNNTT